MIIKEQENQLSLSLNFQILLTAVVWILVMGFVGYQLWTLKSNTSQPALTLGNNVPTIKQANLDVLRSSIKSVTFSNLPTVRPEPFD